MFNAKYRKEVNLKREVKRLIALAIHGLELLETEDNQSKVNQVIGLLYEALDLIERELTD